MFFLKRKKIYSMLNEREDLEVKNEEDFETFLFNSWRVEKIKQMQLDQKYTPMGDDIKSGDQVFVTTLLPAGGANIPLQSMDSTVGPSKPMVVDSEPSSPGQFLLNGLLIFRLGICTVVLGSTILICGICCVATFGRLVYNEAACGVWGGFFIVVAGSLSIASGRIPQNRALNISNLAFHIWALCNCIVGLALFGLNIDYYDNCIRRFWFGSNPYCPAERDEAVAVYSVMVAFACIQIGISITAIVFCCRAFPTCRAGTCCSEGCSGDCSGVSGGCCGETKVTDQQQQHYQPQTFHTGYATMSANAHQIQSGQILYMMTPVAVTTQHLQNAPANQIPQATLVMA